MFFDVLRKIRELKFETFKLVLDLINHDTNLYLFESQEPKDFKNINNNIIYLIFSDFLTLNFGLLVIYISDLYSDLCLIYI